MGNGVMWLQFLVCQIMGVFFYMEQIGYLGVDNLLLMVYQIGVDFEFYFFGFINVNYLFLVSGGLQCQ